MSQILNLNLPYKPQSLLLSHPSSSSSSHHQSFADLSSRLRCNGRVSCLFSDNSKQEQARKALESALGGNKEKFEKWNQEIKKREEAGGGGSSGGGGGGGWFGWGGRFGWSSGDNFWQEAQQTSLTVLCIIALYLIAAKGELLLAVILNPLLFVLRSTRNSFAYTISLLARKLNLASDAKFEQMPAEPVRISSKETVMKKWGSN